MLTWRSVPRTYAGAVRGAGRLSRLFSFGSACHCLGSPPAESVAPVLASLRRPSCLQYSDTFPTATIRLQTRSAKLSCCRPGDRVGPEDRQTALRSAQELVLLRPVDTSKCLRKLLPVILPASADPGQFQDTSWLSPSRLPALVEPEPGEQFMWSWISGPGLILGPSKAASAAGLHRASPPESIRDDPVGR